jgi:hypothetical protein
MQAELLDKGSGFHPWLNWIGAVAQTCVGADGTQVVISAEIVKLREGQMSPATGASRGAYSERDLESVFLREIEGVPLQLGARLTFVARQNRMSVGKDDFYRPVVLPPFHRHLRRLMAVEPKLDRLALPMSARCICLCAGRTFNRQWHCRTALRRKLHRCRGRCGAPAPSRTVFDQPVQEDAVPAISP